MQPKFKVAACAAVILALSGGAADAAPFSASDLLTGFTNIVLGDLTTGAETEGPLFVGGNYNGSGATVNPDGLPNVDLGGGVNGTLVVGGDINANVNFQSGNAQVGGAITGNLNNNGGGIVSTGVAGIPVADVTTVLQDLSNDLAGNNTDTPGGTANTSDNNDINFESGPGDGDGIQYFNINGSILGNAGTFNGIDADPGVTTIINVSGTNLTVNVNANQQLDDVLFNFYEATSLTIGGTFNYSVLAPYADVTLNGGGMFGNLVSNNLQQNSEVRPYDSGNNFDGSLPEPSSTPVSAPATLGLMLTGAGIVTLLVQRRRTVAATTKTEA